MKRIHFMLSLVLCMVYPAGAGAQCFLATENNKIIQQEGECASRHAPCSTFKIAISLMGYNEGILSDTTHPEWNFKPGYADWLDVWKQPHNPTTWMQHSCVWYSQVITQQLGMKKFDAYVKKFQYGNQDVAGDKGQHNGLTRAWLSSSLQISPAEQTQFLQKLLAKQLPVNVTAHEMTQRILFVEELTDGWKLYGKTGSGTLLNKDGSRNSERQIGWFVGWMTKGSRTIVFAYYIEDREQQAISAGLRAKAEAKQKLLPLIAHEKS